MTAETGSAQNEASLFRRILGSFLAAVVGWIPPNLPVVVVALIDWRHSNAITWGVILSIAVMSGKFVFGTWLFVLLPLYLFVPLRSVLWHWPVCTLCGAFCGALILFLYWRLRPLPLSAQEILNELPSLVGAALAGGTACLFGSLTACRFHFARNT
jgi:hypothetical protein